MIDTNSPIYGVVRTVVAAAAGFLVGKGYIEAGMVEAIAGAVATLGVAIWSVVSKKPKPE